MSKINDYIPNHYYTTINDNHSITTAILTAI